ncbi:MAG TPA: class I SAM-dependent methyltransferase [Pyrinomonadaceae bacterium]
MNDPAQRPFYDEYAWAYDLFIPPPGREQCDFIAGAFAARGAGAGSLILDAGCGTGRHARELARRGYVVEGVDLSPSLVSEARRLAAGAAGRDDAVQILPDSFSVGDVTRLPAGGGMDGLLCRGVLNDLLDGRSRAAAFRSFAGALRAGGALVLDVREWEASARRKIREPFFERTVETARGPLTFRSETRVDPGTRLLLVEERHTLKEAGGVERVSAYDFRMRCWTREELESAVTRAGFGRLEFFGAYDRATPAGDTDRLVCVASRA